MFVRSCRLGQTEQGSFVATVECELDVDDLRLRLAEEPFGRKVTTLFARSVARVSDAIRADNLDGLTQRRGGARAR